MDLCSYLYTCILWDYDRAMDICIYLSTCIHWDYDRAMESNEIIPRTSDSLNEGLPIKMTRENFKENNIFSMKKIAGSTLDLFTKAVFSLDKYQLKNMG